MNNKPFWVGVGVALVAFVIWLAVSGTELGLPAAIGFFLVCVGLLAYAVVRQGGNIG